MGKRIRTTAGDSWTHPRIKSSSFYMMLPGSSCASWTPNRLLPFKWILQEATATDSRRVQYKGTDWCSCRIYENLAGNFNHEDTINVIPDNGDDEEGSNSSRTRATSYFIACICLRGILRLSFLHCTNVDLTQDKYRYMQTFIPRSYRLISHFFCTDQMGSLVPTLNRRRFIDSSLDDVVDRW